MKLARTKLARHRFFLLSEVGSSTSCEGLRSTVGSSTLAGAADPKVGVVSDLRSSSTQVSPINADEFSNEELCFGTGKEDSLFEVGSSTSRASKVGVASGLWSIPTQVVTTTLASQQVVSRCPQTAAENVDDSSIGLRIVGAGPSPAQGSTKE